MMNENRNSGIRRNESGGWAVLDHAVRLAIRAHDRQRDRAGAPYILHALYVAAQQETPLAMAVGALHDVAEDCPDWPLEALAEVFPAEVVDRLRLLTRADKHEPYAAYIERIAASGDAIAISVKLADLRHNLVRSRIPTPTPHDEDRWCKYERAVALLAATNEKQEG